ncbi:hypothetical protein [Sphingomonas sp. VNH70]|uniref:hypothetical protein n=1 Tax=Sphingomonas silueang TaxID=3156617 RepID=UPI0032B4541A
MSAGNLARALGATSLALRSYQYGNAAPDLAASIADAADHALTAAGYGDIHALIERGDLAAPRQHGLSVEIEDGRLVIAIGIDALMTAIDGGPHAPEDLDYRILTRDGFAADIVQALEAEDDEGTTLVHVMFDSATERALDEGSLSVEFDEPERVAD